MVSGHRVDALVFSERGWLHLPYAKSPQVRVALHPGAAFNQETPMSHSPREDQPSLRRRSLFAGAGVVGAAAAATALMPAIKPQAPAAVDTPAPLRGGGYSLTDHVKQYYKTTLV
jgi:hypothetical protein